MFATLTGAWPRVLPDGRPVAALEADVAAGRADAGVLEHALDALVTSVLEVQAAAGLELLADGQVRWPDLGLAVAAGLEGLEPAATGRLRAIAVPRRRAPLLVAAWHAAMALAPAGWVVKQALPGPFTLGRRLDAGSLGPRRLTLALADALADEVADLAAAGCAVVEVEEPAAVEIGADEEARALFLEAQHRLLARAPGIHATLAVTGGNADTAGAATIVGAPYRSFLFDLVAGPDNWRLVAATPGERGIVCGALRVDGGGGDPVPLLVWAARYAASTGGRGAERVGLANASSLAGLAPEAATARVQALGRANRLAAMAPADAIAAGLDARAFDARTAAYGRVLPRRTKRRPPTARPGDSPG